MRSGPPKSLRGSQHLLVYTSPLFLTPLRAGARLPSRQMPVATPLQFQTILSGGKSSCKLLLRKKKTDL